jgi:hypothetical protein
LHHEGEPPVVIGVVVDEEGRPLPEAEIVLYRVVGGEERGRLFLDGRRWPEPEAVARPREDGSFRLVAPRPGMFTVVARAPGRVAMESPLWPLLEVTDIGTARLRPDVGWEVEVVDSASLPVPGAAVGSWLRGDRDTRHELELHGGFWRRPQLQVAATDVDGTVRFARLEGEPFRVGVVAAGRFARLSSVTPGEGAPVVVRLSDDPPREIDIEQPDGSAAVGSVVWGAGLFVPLGITGPSGLLRVQGTIERTARIHVSGADGLAARGMLEPAAGGAAEPLRLVLQPPRELVGRVVDAATGAPVAGAWVMQSASPTDFVRTARSGRFRLPLTDASRSLAAEAPGYEGLTWLLEGRPEDWSTSRGPVVVPLRRRATDGPVVKRYQ